MSSINSVVVGDTLSGKTSLIQTFMESKPSATYIPTIFQHSLAVLLMNDQEVSLNIIDTSGDPSYDTLRQQSYAKADFFYICFSLVSPQSLKNAKAKWYPEIRKYQPNAPVVLVGTHADLRTEKASKENFNSLKKTSSKLLVSYNEGNQVAKAINAMSYYECTTYSLDQVFKVFEETSQSIWNSMPESVN